MEKILDKLYYFSLTMNGDLLFRLYGEHLGQHLWNKYEDLNRDWLRWYGYLDIENSKIISDYMEKEVNHIKQSL